MRLQPEQVSQLHSVVRRYFSNISYDLFLYGSRADDALKGGDIDLLLVTSTKGVSLFEDKNLDLLVDIKKQSAIGQRRIDLKATTADQLSTDPFLKVIAQTMVRI
ncbi:MAG: nucleotidyltransferase domain-containing protein [Bdellovibrio sp.]|nr:nucleotidyltransferase domain-containing protein [Bdellovibrio sp.]